MTPDTNSVNGRNLLRLPAVKARVHKHPATIYRHMAKGEFPKPIDLGGGRIAWFEDEITQWLETRPRRVYGAERAAQAAA